MKATPILIYFLLVMPPGRRETNDTEPHVGYPPMLSMILIQFAWQIWLPKQILL